MDLGHPYRIISETHTRQTFELSPSETAVQLAQRLGYMNTTAARDYLDLENFAQDFKILFTSRSTRDQGA
jgi:hypothetical protein